VLFGSREPLGFGLENPQGFGIDERRFIVPGLHWRGAGSLPAGLRQWRRAEGRGLGIGERGRRRTGYGC